jgi:predicted DNA binding CopG/RHH family protein
MKKAMTLTSLRIAIEDITYLKMIAEKQDIYYQQLLRKILSEWVDNHKKTNL